MYICMYVYVDYHIFVKCVYNRSASRSSATPRSRSSMLLSARHSAHYYHYYYYYYYSYYYSYY